MESLDHYLVASFQVDLPLIYRREEISDRISNITGLIDDLVAGYRHLLPLKLIVMPEFSVCPVAYGTTRELLEHLAIGSNSSLFDPFLERASRYQVYIMLGTFLECDPRWPELVFNTALLVGPEGMELKYRKVNPLIPLEICASPADIPDYPDPLFPVADTPIGKIGIGICYDMAFPETARQLALNGAEIILDPSAWMVPWGTAEPRQTLEILTRARAIENSVYLITSCLSPTRKHHPPFIWSGDSMVIDPDGRVLARAGSAAGDGVAITTIHLDEVRARRQQQDIFAPLLHLRTHAYEGYTGEIYPADDLSAGAEVTEDRILAAIQSSRETLGFARTKKTGT